MQGGAAAGFHNEQFKVGTESKSVQGRGVAAKRSISSEPGDIEIGSNIEDRHFEIGTDEHVGGGGKITNDLIKVGSNDKAVATVTVFTGLLNLNTLICRPDSSDDGDWQPSNRSSSSFNEDIKICLDPSIEIQMNELLTLNTLICGLDSSNNGDWQPSNRSSSSLDKDINICLDPNIEIQMNGPLTLNTLICWPDTIKDRDW
ncbi:hypothetical protein CVT25_002164 [Psilocybe cyanescens]|uniref:Uncharacterized protein n=1 Tax=Psilocybe cyanescens TaxID=93625 RepID=A0A409XUJ8_PSICY|nr:hypothetical protein CVT25_002164 [Psilocybe cyanescens]